MKKETLEEALTYTEAAKKEERIFNSKMMSNQETLGDFISRESKSYIESVGIVKGAKWQMERSYSEEEVYQLLYDLSGQVLNNKVSNPKLLSDWFKQFKKK